MEAEIERRMGEKMTDEEQKKLCATLRRMPGMLSHDCNRAANEIERLACIVCEARKLLGENFEVYDKIKGHAVTRAQSDAKPPKARFEEWAFTRGHRNFTKSGGGYLLPEIQKDWLAFKASGPADYIPIGGAGNGA